MVAQDKSPIQCWRDLQAVYGDRGLGKTRVRHWYKIFKLGTMDSSISDKPHTGRKCSVCTEENITIIRELLEEDRRRTVRELVFMSGLSHGTVHRIIQKELQFSHICTKFVPRLLTLEQRNHRADLTVDNLALLADGGKFFMERIVSGDETWLYCFDPQTKQRSTQWLPKGSDCPEKALQMKTPSKKVMLTLFFDTLGPIPIHFHECGETVTLEVYCAVLAKLHENIQLKRPGMWKKTEEGYRKFLLHQDNATPHTSSFTLGAIGENNMELLAHPAYCLDLAPCDFAIFPALKDELKGFAFANVEELKAEACKVLLRWPTDVYQRAIFDMAKRWAKCVACRGAYFEGKGLPIPVLLEFLDHSEDD